MRITLLFIIILCCHATSAQEEGALFQCMTYFHAGRPHTYYYLDDAALKKNSLRYSCLAPAEELLTANEELEFIASCKEFIDDIVSNPSCFEDSDLDYKKLKAELTGVKSGFYKDKEGLRYFHVSNIKKP